MKIEQLTKKTNKGFQINYPNSTLYGTPTLFKVYFGRKYLIWKGKSFYQSVETLSKSIQSCINKGNIDETNFMYHVAMHIKKNGILFGECFIEEMYNDFSTPYKECDGFKVLKMEQEMIDEAIHSKMCLNNNLQAYVPNNTAYISKAQQDKFLTWYYKTHK